MSAPIILDRPDGRISIDFSPPDGPYLTLTQPQWKALIAYILRNYRR